MKRILYCLLLMTGIMFIFASTGFALNMEENVRLFDDAEIMDGKKLHFPQGTILPVYSAPSESAFRGANGKAGVSLKEPFRVLATAERGSWWLIEYDVSGKAKRVGWIRVEEDKPAPSYPSIYDWEYDYELDGDEGWAETETSPDVQTLRFADLGEIRKQTFLTDDPRGEQRTLCTLEKGRRVGLLFEETLGKSGDWVYIITEIGGQKACGFVPGDTVEPVPAARQDGNRLIIEEGIEFLGLTCDILDSGGIEYKDGGPVNAAAHFGMVQGVLSEYPYDESFEYWTIDEVQLPSTLKLMGDDALTYVDIEELIIPEGTVRIRGIAALFGMHIGTLYLPSTLRDFEYCAWFSTVGRYEVAQENPYYKSVDGVVYTKDGKTLVCYPNGKKDEHYAIPKGTENIHAYAFYSYPFYEGGGDPVPIRSLTMPIGLKRIGARSLDGLEELVSLVIPPTVEEIGPDAFGSMTSLSRFSIPERLRGMIREYWFETHEQKAANGDNGELVERELNGQWE